MSVASRAVTAPPAAAVDSAADQPVQPQPQLIDAATMAELTRRSDWRGLARLAAHGAVLAAGGALVWEARGSGWFWPAMVLHGLAVVSLFAALHESVHYTAFRRRSLNGVVAWLAGLAIGLDQAYYRQFHYAHHRHTQRPGEDPELAIRLPHTRVQYAYRLAFQLWIGLARAYPAILRGDFSRMRYLPRGKQREVRASVGAMAVIYGGVAALSFVYQSTAVLWLWVVPLLLAQPFLRFYLLAEHTGCSLDENGLTNTRTTLAAWPIRLLMWNMPYHAEHHLYPQIPFHALPRAHRLAGASVVTAPSYLSTNLAIVRGLGASREATGSG